MFERFDEPSRRVIFFARFEASQFGTPEIETEHFLLAVLHEQKALLDRLRGTPADVESIRQPIIDRTAKGESTPTSVDMPLSMECKRVLAFTFDEAQRLNHQQIVTEHLLLGLLLEEGCFAAEILRGLGLTIEKVRDDLASPPDNA